jgi:hypothetical protein
MPSPSFQIKVVLRPEVPGGFNPDTFDHLLQHQVELAGLDNRYIHTLIDAQVIEDGNAAELTIHSEPHHPQSLTHAFRILHGTPPAAVRAISTDGDVLAEVQLPAPLQAGQRVQIHEQEYVVHRVEWPHRHPETGICAGELDVQHAIVHPVRAMPKLPWPKHQAINPIRQQGHPQPEVERGSRGARQLGGSSPRR